MIMDVNTPTHEPSDPSKLQPPLPVRALVLSSFTPHTGNAVTSARLCAMLSPLAESVSQLNVSDVKDPGTLAAHLTTDRTTLVLGVHAYRAGRLLLDCGVPYAIVLGGTDVNEHLQQAQKRAVICAVIQQATAIVAFTPKLLDDLAAVAPAARSKAFLVPQGVTPAGGTPPPEEELHSVLELDPGERLFLLPAGLRPVKDVLFTAKAMAAWHEHRPGVCLRIVGPELDSDYAREVRLALEHCEGVRYCGALPREQLHGAMRLAEAVINTSHSEGMCNSLLEAMSLGTPVLARANSGNRALIEDGVTGLLFDDADAFVIAAERLLGSDDLRRELCDRALAKVQSWNAEEAAAYRRVAGFVHAARGPIPRDWSFLGMHSPTGDSARMYTELDPNGTLRDKSWRAEAAWLIFQLNAACSALLTVCPSADLRQSPGLNPLEWTIGHVAFTFDMLIAQPLRLPTPGVIVAPRSAQQPAAAEGKPFGGGGSSPRDGGSGDSGTSQPPPPLLRTQAWTVYDSMRVSGAERWAMKGAGSLPDARPYLDQVKQMLALTNIQT